MATKKIAFELDIDGKPIDVVIDKTLNLKQQFRELTKEINKTQEGTKEFELLSSKLGDVKDKMETTTAKSRDLFGSLSLLPGPVGEFSNSVDGAIGTLKTFSAFSFKDLKFQLGETLNDFKDIASNIGKATGITKLYTTLNNALSKSFVAVGVGEGVAAAGARAFAAALVATGIGALIVLLGTAASMLYQMATGEDEATAATKRLNDQIDSQNRLLDLNAASTKRRNAETIAAMKAAGKSEKEIRDATLKNAYNDYTAAYEAEGLARKNYNDNLGKADTETLAKITKSLADREKATKDAYSSYLVLGLNNKAEENKVQTEKNKELEAKNKQHQEKILADNKTADQNLIDLRRENAALAIQDIRKREDKELENQKLAEEDKIKVLQISQEKKNLILSQIDIKYKAKQSDIDKKRKEEDDKKREDELKVTEDFNRKVAEIKIAAIEDETNRSIEERQQKYRNDLSDLEKDKEFIKKSEAEKAEIRKNLTISTENDINKIKLDAKLKSLQEELSYDEARLKTLQEGSTAFFEQQRKIEDEAYALKVLAAKGNQKELERLALEHKAVMDNINEAEKTSKRQQLLATLDLYQQFGAALQQLAGENKGLAIAGLLVEQAAGVAKIIINTQAAAAKAGYFTPLGIATLVAGAASVAVAIAATVKGINQINGASGKNTGGATGPAENSAVSLGRNYGDGGMIDGPRHAAGGVMINAEGGEAVMTRGAVTMFAPLLSSLNQMGGGTSFASGATGGARPDNPLLNNPSASQSPMIMKTYVVSSEMTSDQERQARLKDLSTL